MRYQLALSAAFAICLTAVTTARTSAQSAPEWRVGTGFLISRPNDARLWGVNAQREQSLTRLIVYRSAASVDFLGLAFDPTLITLGADVGVRLRLAPLSAMVAVGPSVAFFAAQRHVYQTCIGSSCSTYQRGYEPGFVLAATGALALGLQVSSELRLFGESRVYVPSGIGRSGYASDPHAAFVELAFGVSLLPTR